MLYQLHFQPMLCDFVIVLSQSNVSCYIFYKFLNISPKKKCCRLCVETLDLRLHFLIILFNLIFPMSCDNDFVKAMLSFEHATVLLLLMQ